ncbi:MAG TPA: hypothetical protein VN944_02405 [Nitrospiria bacterium]|nr:hypothetical protein [Nitrospiria bacterium]
MKKIFLMLLIVFLSGALVPGQSKAASSDKTLEIIFKDAYYGAALGGLLGVALMVFTDRPADHFDYIAYGLAGGVIAGTAYGMVYESSRSFVEVDHGKFSWNLPVPRAEVMRTGLEKRATVGMSLVRYRF